LIESYLNKHTKEDKAVVPASDMEIEGMIEKFRETWRFYLKKKDDICFEYMM